MHARTQYSIAILVLACSEVDSDPQDLHPTQDLDEIDSGPTASDTADSGLEAVQEDDARILTAEIPTQMDCGDTVAVSVEVRNTGSQAWSRDAGYKLGTVEDEDPFYTRDTRVLLPDDAQVLPGQSWLFEFELEAPEEAGSYLTDWQMVHESVRWFGETTEHIIDVSCEATEPEDEPSDVPAGAPDLDEVVWLHTDVSGWAETGTLSSVTFSSDQICLDYDKANDWPVYALNGETDVVGNPWIFIWQDDTWYAGTWEWLRPGQTCKSVDAVAASHIKQEPFPETSSWVPTSGQTYWFMVSGLGRWDERNVEERTNLIEVVWP